MKNTVQTQAERFDDLRVDVANIGNQLEQWNAGVYDAENPHQRLAGTDALISIDAALALLHELRSDLVGQLRRYDDASMIRTDALLRELRAERGES